MALPPPSDLLAFIPAMMFPKMPEFKHVVFSGILVVVYVVSYHFGMKSEKGERALIAFLLFGICWSKFISPIVYIYYRGYTPGLNIYIHDPALIAMLLIMKKSKRWKAKKRKEISPIFYPIGLFFLASLYYSTIHTMEPIFSWLEMVRMVRNMAYFYFAYHLLHSEEDIRFFVKVVIGLIIYAFVIALHGKYIAHIPRFMGPFVHQNTYAMWCNSMSVFCFSMMLGAQCAFNSKENMWYWIGFSIASLGTVLSLSRGSMATMVLQIGLVFAASLFIKAKAQETGKKIKTLSILIMAAIPPMAVLVPLIVKRFESAPKESAEGRHYMNDAGDILGGDYGGAGVNCYNIGVNYIPECQALLAPMDRGVLHNSYYLIYAEMGVVGEVLFLAMIVTGIYLAAKCVWKRDNSYLRYFALALFVGQIPFWAQNWLEWMFKNALMPHQIYIFWGIIASLAPLEKEIAKNKKAEQVKKMMMLQMMMGGTKSKSVAARPAQPAAKKRLGRRLTRKPMKRRRKL